MKTPNLRWNSHWKSALALFLILLSPQLSHAALLFKDGDRVVFYGDSITEQRMYTCDIQDYIHCRYPDLKLTFFNAGWSGDVAPGGLKRLERDVLPLKPTVVTLFFGMNDGMYQPISDFSLKLYSDAMENLIKTLQTKGIRVIVFSPGCIDPDKRDDLKAKNYNATLKALSDAALKLAETYKCDSVNVHDPMLAFQDAQKAKSPGFVMIGDGVHPTPQGCLAMAQIMLKGLGAEPMNPLGSVDLASGSEEGVHVVSKSPEHVELETVAPPPVPFWFDQAASMSIMRDSGFLDFAGQKLTVKGLAPGAYRLTVGSVILNQLTADALAKGIMIPGSYSKQAKNLFDLIMQKQNVYFTTWREVQLPLADVEESKPVVAALVGINDVFNDAIYKVLKPEAKTTITLDAIPPGSNLALHALYVCSDPNMFGYGVGALTDGSWVADPGHCFATGVTDSFPKTVTVDLAAPVKVGRVVLGVPPYGSTKTIKVSVSRDGKEFTDVGTHQFSLSKEEKFTYSFAPVEAQFVRLTYPDHFTESVNNAPTFCFTTELEAYSDGEAPAPVK